MTDIPLRRDDSPAARSKSEIYGQLLADLAAVFAGERDGLANLSNMSALLYSSLPALNWAGFYLMRDAGLVLGPFQGKVACVRIALGQGVCGTAAQRRDTVVVPDVHAFPGHIACDSASRSEIVVPLISQDRILGVLDLDSPQLARFDDEDARHLNAAVRMLLTSSDLSLSHLTVDSPRSASQQLAEQGQRLLGGGSSDSVAHRRDAKVIQRIKTGKNFRGNASNKFSKYVVSRQILKS